MLQQIVTLHSSHRVYTCVILRISLISGFIYFSNDSPKQNVAIVFLVKMRKKNVIVTILQNHYFAKRMTKKQLKINLSKAVPLNKAIFGFTEILTY